jgi:hypothetical protein
MVKTFVEYNFDTDTIKYPSSYDSSKINLGYLMKKSVDENNKIYVSPLEPVFLRGFEIYGSINNGTISGFKYNEDKIWVFYANPLEVNSTQRIFLSEYSLSANTFNEMGSINSSLVSNSNHRINNLTSSLEYHTGGTVSVSFSSVTGNSTSWLTGGVCAGNRIGFGSTDPGQITTWYEIVSVVGDTQLTIKQGIYTDGLVFSGLTISAGTPYVIEDLRLMYSNYGGNLASIRASYILKGLRKEVFSVTPTTVPAATTVDNQRASYKLMDTVAGVTSGNNNYQPDGFLLFDKVSLTEQYGYSLSYVSTTAISIQKFNVRASLTGLTGSRSASAFVLTTGNQNHNGTNTLGYNTMLKGPGDNIYVTHSTRVSRIPTSVVTASSTTFIVDQMIENPPGGTNTLPLTNSLDNGHYLPLINKMYISNNGISSVGYRSYITPYISGSSQFERYVHINDQIQQSTYLDFNFNYLTTHTSSSYFYNNYAGGISFLSRFVSNNNNVMYAVALEADKDYENLTNACIITPSIITQSAVTYDKVYFNTTSTWSNNNLTYSREIFDSYYRTTGITTDTGGWNLISQSGNLSGITSNEIQFKFTFRTMGFYSVPTRIHGITLTYTGNTNPISTSFYEPSLKNNNLTNNIFSWRQNDSFQSNIPNLKLNIYNITDNNLLLSDDVNTSSNGIWQYSTDGNIWNSWVPSADTVGNYIRYSASTLSASGLKIKPILYI